MRCMGVRGAIDVAENTEEAILAATHELLTAMIDANNIDPDDVGSMFMTTTMDLNAQYPAVAARALGWMDVAIMCGHEMDVPHGLPQCLRILINWHTTLSAQDIQHVYLGAAQRLRPDRAEQLNKTI
ncbi:MAG: chorismate mutase [Anaerolineae bacterium]|nr:chorismate mutase [Anaerolineae bacterium]